MTTPVVALVGRPNVGKSTLFNRLTRTRDALVADFPGLTRDRKYGHANISGYDFIVIDTPPSLGVLTVNAFTCATDILIPTTAGIFATAGISQLNETVASVQRYCNPGVKIRGILFTRFNPRANISRQMKELAEQLSEYISAPIYETYIRSAVVVEEAQANRQDIFDYADKSTVSEDYRAFIEEFLKGVNE